MACPVTYRAAGPGGTRVLHLRGSAQRRRRQAQRHQRAPQPALQQRQPRQRARGHRGARAGPGGTREPRGRAGQRALRRPGQRDQSPERAAGPRQHHRRRTGGAGGGSRRATAADDSPSRAPVTPPVTAPRRRLSARCRRSSRAGPAPRGQLRALSAGRCRGPLPAPAPAGPAERCFGRARGPAPALPDPEPFFPSRVSPLVLLQPFCDSFSGVYSSFCSCAPSLAILLCPFMPGHCCYRALCVKF